MTQEKIMTSLFEFSSPTYYKWIKQDKRKIFDLLNYAFSKHDLEEFINTGKINKIEEIGNKAQFFDLANKFYKTTRYITNFKIAKKVLHLLEKSYKENNNSVVIEKIAEIIYDSNMEIFDKDDVNKNTTSMKLTLLNLIQKQDLLVLEYICRNRKELERNSLRRTNMSYSNKIDFSYASLAHRA